MKTTVPVLLGSTWIAKQYGAYVRHALKLVRPGEWCVETLRSRGLCALDGALIPMNPPAWTRVEEAYRNARGFRARARAAFRCAVSYIGYGVFGALASLGAAALVFTGMVAWGTAAILPLPVLAVTGAIEGLHQMGVRVHGRGKPVISSQKDAPARDHSMSQTTSLLGEVGMRGRTVKRNPRVMGMQHEISLRGRGERTIDF